MAAKECIQSPKVRILALINKYEEELRRKGISKRSIDPRRGLASAKKEEVLSYALFLCDEVRDHAGNSGRQRKLGYLIGVMQTCLSVGGLYTIEDLENDSRKVL